MTDFRKLAVAYVALLVLLALTVGSSFIELGGANSAINLGIAAGKAAVIALAFMHLSAHGVLPRLVVAVIGLWLLIMYALTLIG